MAGFFGRNYRNMIIQNDTTIQYQITAPYFFDVGGSVFCAVAIGLLNDLDKLSLVKHELLQKVVASYFDDTLSVTDHWLLMSPVQKLHLVDALTLVLSHIAFVEIGANPLLYSELFIDDHAENWTDLMRFLFRKPDKNCIAALARALKIQIDVYAVKRPDDIYVLTRYANNKRNEDEFPFFIVLQLQQHDYVKPLVTNHIWHNLCQFETFSLLTFDHKRIEISYNLSELKRRVLQSFESLKERFLHVSAGINAMVLAGDLTIDDLKAIYCKGLNELPDDRMHDSVVWGFECYFERAFRAIGYEIMQSTSSQCAYEEQLMVRLRDSIARLICLKNPDLVDNYLDDRSNQVADERVRAHFSK